MKPNPDAAPAAPRKPRFALALATSLGVGYVPRIPGTIGSLVGVGLAWKLRLRDLSLLSPFLHPTGLLRIGKVEIDSSVLLGLLAVTAVALVGVWSSDRVAKHVGKSDPQIVVVDEVSGQMIALLGAGWLVTLTSDNLDYASRLIVLGDPGWKYLLLGFILFRVFDIWKPFPVRQAEKLPGGWGIMADDWVAAVYAALGLWVARYLGL